MSKKCKLCQSVMGRTFPTVHYVPGETTLRGGRFEGMNSLPCVSNIVWYGARFHKFSCSFSNISMATVVERIMRKRLLDSFIHNSAIITLSANSSFISNNGHRLCQLSCCSSVRYCSELPRQLKLTGDVQD